MCWGGGVGCTFLFGRQTVLSVVTCLITVSSDKPVSSTFCLSEPMIMTLKMLGSVSVTSGSNRKKAKRNGTVEDALFQISFSVQKDAFFGKRLDYTIVLCRDIYISTLLPWIALWLVTASFGEH